MALVLVAGVLVLAPAAAEARAVHVKLSAWRRERRSALQGHGLPVQNEAGQTNGSSRVTLTRRFRGRRLRVGRVLTVRVAAPGDSSLSEPYYAGRLFGARRFSG